MKAEEPKNSATISVPSPHTTPIPSPPFTLIPSPHQSLVPSAHASLLKPSGSLIQIVDLGDGKSSSNESTKSYETPKKSQEVDKS